MTDATISTRSEDGQVHLAVAGEIDVANAAHVEREIHAAIDNHVRGVVVDLADVTYIDSAGVKVLVLLANRLDQIRTTFELIAPPGSLARRVVDVTGLGIYASEQS